LPANFGQDSTLQICVIFSTRNSKTAAVLPAVLPLPVLVFFFVFGFYSRLFVKS
jgi:hypothetical protein